MLRVCALIAQPPARMADPCAAIDLCAGRDCVCRSVHIDRHDGRDGALAGESLAGVVVTLVNGLVGPSTSGTVVLQNYNRIAVSYDPDAGTVVGSINGVATAALPYAVSGVRYVGFQGNGIVTKLLAARPKDLEDVRELVASRGASLDHARIGELLALLEQALGQSDLVPLYQRLRDEAARS
jgi:hypothetical protein